MISVGRRFCQRSVSLFVWRALCIRVHPHVSKPSRSPISHLSQICRSITHSKFSMLHSFHNRVGIEGIRVDSRRTGSLLGVLREILLASQVSGLALKMGRLTYSMSAIFAVFPWRSLFERISKSEGRWVVGWVVVSLGRSPGTLRLVRWAGLA